MSRFACPLAGCNLQDELFASFENILAMADKRGEPYARIVLENSGVAEPSNIRDKFSEAEEQVGARAQRKGNSRPKNTRRLLPLTSIACTERLPVPSPHVSPHSTPIRSPPSYSNMMFSAVGVKPEKS